MNKQTGDMHTHEIHVGEHIDISTGQNCPNHKFGITQEQYDILRIFANTRKDKYLNTVYKLNDVEFIVWPHFCFDSENK